MKGKCRNKKIKDIQRGEIQQWNDVLDSLQVKFRSKRTLKGKISYVSEKQVKIKEIAWQIWGSGIRLNDSAKVRL